MMKNGNSLTVIQLNDSHACFDLHQEMFWQGSQAVYRPAGGFARIAAIVKQIRAANQERVLFCDCGETLHGTYPVLKIVTEQASLASAVAITNITRSEVWRRQENILPSIARYVQNFGARSTWYRVFA
jgi:hypothetical protein